MVVSLAGTIESEMAGAMSNAIIGVIDGTMTVKEAFSQMFKNIGAAFIQMATQMIAKALVMKALGILTGGAGGGGSAFAGSFQDPGAAFIPSGGFSFAGGGYTGNAPRVGGLDGQGGFMAMLHPQETVVDHTRDAMDRYGSSAKPAGGHVNVSYSVTEINSVRYVTEDQFRAGMSQAARQGADGGSTKALRTLKNSRSQRARLGMT
jgi:hypothetical protein